MKPVIRLAGESAIFLQYDPKESLKAWRREASEHRAKFIKDELINRGKVQKTDEVTQSDVATSTASATATAPLSMPEIESAPQLSAPAAELAVPAYPPQRPFPDGVTATGAVTPKRKLVLKLKDTTAPTSTPKRPTPKLVLKTRPSQ